MNIKNTFCDKMVVDAALKDLEAAYDLVSEVAKTSRGNSKSIKNSIVALTFIENGFNALSHYGTPEQALALKSKIDKARIIPEL